LFVINPLFRFSRLFRFAVTLPVSDNNNYYFVIIFAFFSLIDLARQINGFSLEIKYRFKEPSLETDMDCKKRTFKKARSEDWFEKWRVLAGLKLGQDLEIRAAHSYQKL